MKIGIYDPYLDTLGGGEKYMLTIAECLSNAYSVDVFWNEAKILDKAYERFGLDFRNVRIRDNILSVSNTFATRFMESSQYNSIFYLSDGSIPLLLSKNLIVHFQFPVEWIKGRSIKTRIKLSRIKKIICNSQFTKSHIDKTFGVESIVIYPPVDIKYVKKIPKANLILHVGRFAEANTQGSDFKKQGIMVDAFKEMVGNGLQGWKFILVISLLPREKDNFEKLKRSAEGFPIEFVINTSNNKVWEEYAKAKIYWHASGFGEDLEKYPERAEHFGIATAEAMGAGAVPVVINAGGQKEIVMDGENGFLWDTLSELGEKTMRLIKDEKLRLELSENAKKSVERFNKDRFCKEVNDILV